MTERVFQAKFIKKLRKKGWEVLKNDANLHKGIPDLLVLSPFGECFFVEVKQSAKAERTSLQIWWSKRLKDMGQWHFWLYPENEKEVLTKMGFYDN